MININYRALLALCLVALSFAVTSCDAIGTIFKAGAWVGVIGVLLVLALVWWLISRFRR